MNSKPGSSPGALQVLRVAHKHLCGCGRLYLAATAALAAYAVSIPLRGGLLNAFVSFIQLHGENATGPPPEVESCPCYPGRDPPGLPAFLLFVAAFGGLYCAEAGLLYLSCRLIFQTTSRLEGQLREQTFQRISDRPLAVLKHFPAADLQVLFSTDIALERRFAVNFFWGLMFGAFQVVFGLAYMAILDFRSTALALALLGAFWVALPTASALRLSMRATQALGRVVARFDNMVDCLPVVRAYDIAETLQLQFKEELRPYIAAAQEAETSAGLFQTALTEALSLYSTCVTLTLGYAVFRGQLSIGQYFAFLHTFTSVLSPARGLADFCRQALTFGSSVQRMDDFLEATAPPPPPPPVAPGVEATEGPPEPRCEAPTLTLAVTLEDVSFRYSEGGPLVLKGLKCTVPANSYTCIVGTSGCGKTTLLRLLLRELLPTSGRITFDGHDAARWPAVALLRLMGVVFQDHHILHGTVLDNIRCGKPAASDVECMDAARRAGLHAFAERLPHGYQTRLGPPGDSVAALSGGERQRLCFARALVRRPRLLLLDEATGDVDMETEAHIMEGIDRLVASGSATVLSITHRLHTTRSADHIIVLEGGGVAEAGTYDQLAAAGGAFAAMLRQASAASPKPISA
eukprot:EG_transcript_5066